VLLLVSSVSSLCTGVVDGAGVAGNGVVDGTGANGDGAGDVDGANVAVVPGKAVSDALGDVLGDAVCVGVFSV